MRLVHSTTLGLQSFARNRVPDYVILSHRWFGDEELTFEDLRDDRSASLHIDARGKRGYAKFRSACDQAARDGYEWIWIDSCCIDRSSSAELQESINSMWDYYAQANICYAYLSDVPDGGMGWDEAFSKSEWWSRGWTLQELLAPDSVEFYASDWTAIGTRAERHEEIASITGISPDALTKRFSMDDFSAAERLSWAAHRQVTREEDESYALLGLFEVNMPLLYGEGRERAFARLQEAIYTAMYDSSLFLFRYSPFHDSQPLLAGSAMRFCQRSSCVTCEYQSTTCFPTSVRYENVVPRDVWTRQAHENIYTTVTRTRCEASTTLQLLEFAHVAGKLVFIQQDPGLTYHASHVAVLNFTLEGEPGSALCLPLLQATTDGDAFRRLNCFPALLPCAEQYVSNLRTRKVLIISGPDSLNDEQPIFATFFVESDCGIVRAWKPQHQRLEDDAQTSQPFCTIRTTPHRENRNAAEMSAFISLELASPSTIKLRLVQFRSAWSIKEVYETNVYENKRRKKDRKLFASTICSDRCAVNTSGGAKVSIALRRLAVPHGAHGEDSAKRLRYRILLTLL